MTGKFLISGGRVFFGDERAFRPCDVLVNGEDGIERVANEYRTGC